MYVAIDEQKPSVTAPLEKKEAEKYSQCQEHNESFLWNSYLHEDACDKSLKGAEIVVSKFYSILKQWYCLFS